MIEDEFVRVKVTNVRALFLIWLYRKLKNKEFRKLIQYTIRVREAEHKIAVYKMFELLAGRGYSKELLQECTSEEITQLFKTTTGEDCYGKKES